MISQEQEEGIKIMVFLGRMLWFLGFVEILVFFGVVGEIGLFRALLIMMLFMAGGFLILQQQGLEMLRLFFSQNPQNQQDRSTGFKLMLSAILFIIPGFVSDVLGLLLFIPGVAAAVSKKYMPQSWDTPQSSGQPPAPGDVIEGEYRIIEDPPQQEDRLQ